MPKVNIVVPVYNGAATIQRLLEAIVAQVFTDFRVMIIDNASTDNTGEICRRYADRDTRFQYFRHKENMGFSFSYSRGYYASMDCDFMVYFAADMYPEPDYLFKCVKALETTPEAALAYSYCRLMVKDEPGYERIIKDDFNLSSMSQSQRYLTIITRLDLCTAFFGVIRMSFYMRHSNLYTIISAAADALTLAALALDGPFIETREPLLNRTWSNPSQETYEERVTRLADMSNAKPSFNNLLFHYHISAHITLVTTLGWPLKETDELSRQTVKILMERYRWNLEEERRIFISGVMSGNWFTYLGEECDPNEKLNEAKLLAAMKAAALVGALDKFLWLPIEPEGYHHVRAMLYLYQGRKTEAQAALGRELNLHPTFRPSLELQAQLKKIAPADGQ